MGLGVACWPGRVADWALRGMLTYSSLATLYLVVLGFRREWVGELLWPAVAVHAILTVLLVWAWFKERKTETSEAWPLTRPGSSSDTALSPCGRGCPGLPGRLSGG